MDDASQIIIAFVEALQDVRRRLVHIAGRCFRRGAAPRLPFVLLGGTPLGPHEAGAEREPTLVLGVNVAALDGTVYELAVALCRDDRSWTVSTQACADDGENELRHLRRFPERKASDLSSLLQQLRSAAEDLAGLVSILTTKPRNAEPGG